MAVGYFVMAQNRLKKTTCRLISQHFLSHGEVAPSQNTPRIILLYLRRLPIRLYSKQINPPISASRQPHNWKAREAGEGAA